MKKITLLLACLFTFTVYAQEEDGSEDNRLSNIDWKEDTTEVVTVNDIIKEQQAVTSRYSRQKHFTDVWSRRSYLNFSYNTSSMEMKESGAKAATGLDEKTGGLTTVPKFKSDWGASLQVGRSYRLHKEPIANVAQFCIDYTGIDLNLNHYKAEEGKVLYNSAATYTSDGDEYYYTPWLLEKYEVNYGMSLGPSLILAPFTYINNADGLHHLKFHVYFHIGYHASALWMQNDEDKDFNPDSSTSLTTDPHKVMKDNLKMDWGHGMMTSFGVAMMWKFIGIGYEHRSSSIKYQAMTKGDFSSDKFKFDNVTNRIYLTIRSGR